MEKKVLVVAPHPDDETLGCGGTLLKHKEAGDKIYWMTMTNIHVANGWDHAKVEERQNEIAQVSKMYRFDKVFHLDFPTTCLDTIAYSVMIEKVSQAIKGIQPAIVYLPNRNDIHTDHKKTVNVVMSCCKNFRVPEIERILMYEVLSETEFAPALNSDVFIPNVFNDISEYFEQKVDIFKIYKSEVMEPPLPRSIEAITNLAQLRGSRISKKYAEAFCLLFEKIE